MRKGKVAMAAVVIVVVLLAAAWSIVGYMDTRDIEEPEYSVERKASGYEIREYAPQIRAEIVLEGPYRESLYAGFRGLADFIFGNNTANGNISMTAPVIAEQQQSRKIAMTAPVMHEAAEDSDRHVIAFVMPREYTLETLPRPNNPEITIRRMNAQRVAVTRFSGYATERKATRHVQRLKKALERDGVSVAGEPQIAQYNPPWTPPYMRRNEILIPIE